MATPYTYQYDAQLKKYIEQFMRIFSGFQVQYGVDRDTSGNNDFKTAKVFYGDQDRIVASVLSNRDNRPNVSLPIMTGYMQAIELNPEAKKPQAHTEHLTYVNEGTGDRNASERTVGVPYKMLIDLTIWASNTEQHFQLLEQILLLFNPTLTLQKSENIHDWTSLSVVELTSISPEQNYPSATEDRMIVTTLSFSLDIWLNYPYKELTSGIIEEITLNTKDETINIDGLNFDDTLTIDVNTNYTEYTK